MEIYDVALGWPEPVERNDLFMASFERECRARKLKLLFIDTKNIDRVSRDISKGSIRIKLYLDMASETFEPQHPFTKLVYAIKDSGARIVDDPDDVKSAADKSITHYDLVRSKVPVPYTVVIRHWEPSHKLSAEEAAGLGTPFVIKPALGYGQRGVKIIRKVRNMKDIAEARQFSPGDNFLMQEFIDPLVIENKPAWFRVYQLFGEIIPCWWNPQTNEYRQVTLREMTEHKLMPLARIASEIGRITRIDWFSCEIAINAKNRKFVAIDYMNDQCAIYPKSEHADGVPDELIAQLAERIVEKAWRFTRGEYTLTYRAIWFPKMQVKDENA